MPPLVIGSVDPLASSSTPAPGSVDVAWLQDHSNAPEIMAYLSPRSP